MISRDADIALGYHMILNELLARILLKPYLSLLMAYVLIKIYGIFLWWNLKPPLILLILI